MKPLQMSSDLNKELGRRLRAARLEAGITTEEADVALAIGTGWTHGFEEGAVPISIDAALSMVSLYQSDVHQMFDRLDALSIGIYRSLNAEEVDGELIFSFPLGEHDATYFLPDATSSDWRKVLDSMQGGFAANDLVGAVVESFQCAMRLWPNANPSDIWTFVIAQAFLDPFNHPARDARRDWPQSWKRTAGWALERVVVAHYQDFLAANSVSIAILPKPEIAELFAEAGLGHEAVPDKADVMLFTNHRGRNRLVGVVHVKASFAERRTDDIPMSRALIAAGYFSPLWTLDIKSRPGPLPVNIGELGPTLTVGESDQRSEKRKDIEQNGSFSGCFSYNARTIPTPQDQQDVAARVFVCNFADPNDEFSRAVIKAASIR